MPYKRGKKWKAQVKIGKDRMEKQFNTKKEAMNWEAEMRKKPVSEWREKIDTVCLIDWAHSYLDYANKKFSNGTYKEKKAMFKLFFKKVDPYRPVENLKPKDVLEYVLEQEEQRSGYSANKDRKNLVAAWNWGMKYMDPLLPGPNPCLVERMNEVRHPRYIPPVKDFWKVYNVATGQDRVMLLTFLYLACRRGEAFRLEWSDVDFVNYTIRLYTRKRKDGTLEYDILPMTDELREALKWWWANRPIKTSPNVFVCLDENQKNYGKPFTHRNAFVKQLCKIAEVQRFGFHAIRHLTATIVYHKGYELAVIQKILRHQNASTTQRYLQSLSVEEARDALQSLSQDKGKILFFPEDKICSQTGA